MDNLSGRAMADDNVSTETLIARLSWRPQHEVDSMLNVRGSIKSTVLPSTPASSSMGLIDALPTEILHSVLASLDFRSLSRFACVCRRGKEAVDALPGYQDLIKHASTALISLSRMKLLVWHSAASIYAALLSENCVACHQYGPFLFLPTCERCCYNCLRLDQSLRVVDLRLAGMCFGLAAKDLDRIPAILNVPRSYSSGLDVLQKRRSKLVSVKQAKELGIATHGSEEAMNGFIASKNAGNPTNYHPRVLKWLRGSRSDPQFEILYSVPTYTLLPTDHFFGMASTRFPFLSQSKIPENGLWCFGCQVIGEDGSRNGVLPTVTHIHALRSILEKPNYGLIPQARSKSEFMKHIRECKGSMDILQIWNRASGLAGENISNATP